jgi:hypothetical protein
MEALMINFGELRKLVNSVPTTNDHMEVKVWLPGSRISLGASLIVGPAAPAKPGAEDCFLLEGFVDTGLDTEEDSDVGC